MILKSYLPMLPLPPFRAFLFGFSHVSGVYMSIASNISIKFCSDCNTLATHAGPIYAKVESFNKKGQKELNFMNFVGKFFVSRSRLYCSDLVFLGQKLLLNV